MQKRKAYERFVIICGIISLVDIVVRVVRYLYPKIKKNTEKFVGDDVEELVEQLFDMSGVKLDKGEESEDECKKQSKESIITEIANMKEETYLEDLLDDMMDEEEESVKDTSIISDVDSSNESSQDTFEKIDTDESVSEQFEEVKECPSDNTKTDTTDQTEETDTSKAEEVNEDTENGYEKVNPEIRLDEIAPDLKELADRLRQQLENSEGKRKRKALFRGRKRR